MRDGGKGVSCINKKALRILAVRLANANALRDTVDIRRNFLLSACA